MPVSVPELVSAKECLQDSVCDIACDIAFESTCKRICERADAFACARDLHTGVLPRLQKVLVYREYRHWRESNGESPMLQIKPHFLSCLLLGLSIGTVDAASLQSVRVSSPAALVAAVKAATSRAETVIELEDGVYRLQKTLRINADRVTLRSRSGKRDAVVLVGNGMRKTPAVDNLLEVSGKHVSLIGLTLQDAGNHLIQVRGERDADYFRLADSVLRDSYEQLLKVTGAKSKTRADFGVVQNTLFEYSENLGPNYYIGGIDAHGATGWLVEGNTFRNIASPGDRAAEFAVHFWTGSADNRVRDNLIINSDRGIGFGLGKNWARHNRGGDITGNIILHLRSENPFTDVGIALENSPDTLVSRNAVYMTHAYPNAIEYRFLGTENVSINNNITNKAITSRNGASAAVVANQSASISSTSLDYLETAYRELLDALPASD